MGMQPPSNPVDIRAAALEYPKLRGKKLVRKLVISEGQLIADCTGLNVTRIDANPDRLIPAVINFGEVVALTRAGDCVNEKIGVYENYHTDEHAVMTLGEQIDLRILPKHWLHAFAVIKEKDSGVQRSLQVFDADGSLIFQVFGLSNKNKNSRAAWGKIINTLAHVQVAA